MVPGALPLLLWPVAAVVTSSKPTGLLTNWQRAVALGIGPEPAFSWVSALCSHAADTAQLSYSIDIAIAEAAEPATNVPAAVCSEKATSPHTHTARTSSSRLQLAVRYAPPPNTRGARRPPT